MCLVIRDGYGVGTGVNTSRLATDNSQRAAYGECCIASRVQRLIGAGIGGEVHGDGRSRTVGNLASAGGDGETTTRIAFNGELVRCFDRTLHQRNIAGGAAVAGARHDNRTAIVAGGEGTEVQRGAGGVRQRDRSNNFSSGGTEFGIGWIPFGGYVKISGMVDESMDKEQMAKPPEPWEFRSKPAWQRLIIMVGGVTVNLILGFGLLRGRSYLKYLMGTAMPLDDKGWLIFTQRWIMFFVCMAALNEGSRGNKDGSFYYGRRGAPTR